MHKRNKDEVHLYLYSLVRFSVVRAVVCLVVCSVSRERTPPDRLTVKRHWRHRLIIAPPPLPVLGVVCAGCPGPGYTYSPRHMQCLDTRRVRHCIRILPHTGTGTSTSTSRTGAAIQRTPALCNIGGGGGSGGGGSVSVSLAVHLAPAQLQHSPPARARAVNRARPPPPVVTAHQPHMQHPPRAPWAHVSEEQAPQVLKRTGILCD